MAPELNKQAAGKVENLYTPDSIRTVGGAYVNMRTLELGSLTIEDVAHALSNVPRFGGHLPVFYSVGLHCIGVHDAVRYLPKAVRMQALMHDASEAFLGDMPSPIKALLPDYQALEAQLMDALSERFGFDWPMYPEVKKADRVMLEVEWHGFMLNPLAEAGWGHPDPILEPTKVRERFVELYNELKP